MGASPEASLPTPQRLKFILTISIGKILVMLFHYIFYSYWRLENVICLIRTLFTIRTTNNAQSGKTRLATHDSINDGTVSFRNR